MSQFSFNLFTRFVYQASYDLAWYNPRQLPIIRDVILLGEFTMFASQDNFESTQTSRHQFSDDREVIQSHSSYWKYIQR